MATKLKKLLFQYIFLLPRYVAYNNIFENIKLQIPTHLVPMEERMA